MLKRFVIHLMLIAALAVGLSLAADASAEDKLSDFMKAKLTHSEKVLEGLSRGDYALIVKHSQAMSLLCEDELWSVLMTPEYLQRSKEFRRSVDAITDAGREKNLESATLAYVDSTLKCVNCHKYVRGIQENR
jgi:NurA-like 5'-3' nuclease